MSKEYKIFTSGAMSGLSNEEQLRWRWKLEKEIKSRIDKNITYIHPPLFFDYDYPDQKIVKEWEINQIIDSDIVVFNLSNIRNSIGTHIEMGVVEAVNRLGGKHISTVGIGIPNTDHPWIQSGIFYQAKDIEEAADFICTYLVI
jgi:hypothetical protein